jgi:hypothetical protein
VNAALVGGNDRSDAHSANKTKRKDKSEKEELSAPTKRKQKTPKLPTIKELDEDDETIHVVKRKERVSTGKNADLSEPRTESSVPVKSRKRKATEDDVSTELQDGTSDRICISSSANTDSNTDNAHADEDYGARSPRKLKKMKTSKKEQKK